jgi:hypothetical protein
MPTGAAMMPRLVEAMVVLAQNELYTEAPHLLRLLTGLRRSTASFWRLAQQYGKPVSSGLAQRCAPMPTEDEVAYCMADGSMILTDDGYREVKVARVFTSTRRTSEDTPPPKANRSMYVAHLGGHEVFEAELSALCASYKTLGSRVVCISDGATWLKAYWEKQFPEAIQILDIGHVIEKVSSVAQAGIADEQERKVWVQRQQEHLRQSRWKTVCRAVKRLAKRVPSCQSLSEQVQAYLSQNAYRMDYQTYLKQGLRIGSGAVEAAHRTLVQSRMKRSGQRWSETGAQHILNLRVAFKSQCGHLVTDLIHQNLQTTS